jgi:hypothetical protein
MGFITLEPKLDVSLRSPLRWMPTLGWCQSTSLDDTSAYGGMVSPMNLTIISKDRRIKDTRSNNDHTHTLADTLHPSPAGSLSLPETYLKRLDVLLFFRLFAFLYVRYPLKPHHTPKSLSYLPLPERYIILQDDKTWTKSCKYCYFRADVV